MAVRDDIEVNWSLSPRIVTVRAPSTEVTIQDLHDTLRDIEDEPLEMTFGSSSATGSIIETAGKEALGGGVSVGLTSTLQNAKISFEARQIISASGTVTSADATGTFLNDNTATFITDGVEVGSWIVNMTDGSGATAIKVISETQIQTDVLDGGSDNQFDLNDAYRIWPVIQVSVSGGNLVALDDALAELDPILPTFGTQVVRTSSSSATLQELLDIQFSSFGGEVTVDPTSPYSGTVFPTGTPRQPVNNLSDALDIANLRGLKRIFIEGTMTVDSGLDFRGLDFQGRGISSTVITVDTNALVDGCSFHNLNIQGTLDGNVHIDTCTILDLNYVDGLILNCLLKGTLTLSGSSDATLVDCYDGFPGLSRPTIDFAGSGTSVNILRYAGGLRFQNKTGVDPCSVEFTSGILELASTVTNGTITVRGIGIVEDSSTGSAVIDTRALISKEALFNQIIPGVYIDTINGVSGTSESVGLPQNPVNNIADAYTIATRDGFTAYIIRGSVSLDRDYSNWRFEGLAETQANLDFNGQNVANSVFSNLDLTGTYTGRIEAHMCKMANIVGLDGVFRQVTFTDSTNGYALANGADVYVSHCESGVAGSGRPFFTFGTTGSLSIRSWSGGCDIFNCTVGCSASLDLSQGSVTLDASNTGGEILVRGVGDLTDNSGGTTVVDKTLTADRVWAVTAGAGVQQDIGDIIALVLAS